MYTKFIFLSYQSIDSLCISSSWIHIQKGKLLAHQLQAHDVINKLNLDVILHYDLGYMDLLGIHNSLNYLSWLRKNVFAMIWQLGSPTFFVTFISVESKLLNLLKCLYDLNSRKLRFNIPFDKLEPKHVIDLIQCDLITCARYYVHHWDLFVHCVWKIIPFLGILLKFYLLQNFKVMGINMNMDFYRFEMHQFMVWIRIIQLKTLWINI
jgi:hypothetical protein